MSRTIPCPACGHVFRSQRTQIDDLSPALVGALAWMCEHPGEPIQAASGGWKRGQHHAALVAFGLARRLARGRYVASELGKAFLSGTATAPVWVERRATERIRVSDTRVSVHSPLLQAKPATRLRATARNYK